jgi:hypothetical protein
MMRRLDKSSSSDQIVEFSSVIRVAPVLLRMLWLEKRMPNKCGYVEACPK